jgi:dienelactone hydrolase
MRVPILLPILLAMASGAAAAKTEGGGIGMTSFVVTDAARRDTLKPGLPRAWTVDAYYPTDARAAHASPYLADQVVLDKLVAAKYYDQPQSALRTWAARPSPAIPGAPQHRGARLPLIVVLPGSGVARANYAILAAHLVRRGFVVAVIDLPYLGIQRLPDGRVLDANDDPLAAAEKPEDYAPRIAGFVGDVSKSLDRLPKAVTFDPRRITVTGHSSGGAVAVDVCRADRRVEGCIDFEGGLEPTATAREGVSKPVLIAASRAKGRPEPPHDAAHPDMLDQMRAEIGKTGARSSWTMKITGGSHMSYSDAPEVMPDTLSRFGGELVSPARSFDLYTGLVAAFARAYAPGGGGNAAFEAYARRQPEVTRLERAGPRS